MAIFLFLLLVAVILGLIGAVVEGMLYLLIIAILLVVADVAFIATRRSRRSHRSHLRQYSQGPSTRAPSVPFGGVNSGRQGYSGTLAADHPATDICRSEAISTL